MKDILYIVMPAFNEEGSIKEVVEDWYKNLPNNESKIIVDAVGSTDKTIDIIKEMQRGSYPNIIVLEEKRRKHGPSLINMYKMAINSGADYVFQTDSDGQTNPEEFRSFWNERNLYDCILGNRVVRGDGKNRKFVENTVCRLLYHYFKVKVPDANCPFRLIKASVLKKYIDKLPEDYNLPNIMLTTYFVKYNEKVKFEEITFKPRSKGENSIDTKKIIKTGLNALKDFRKFKKDMKNDKKSI